MMNNIIYDIENDIVFLELGKQKHIRKIVFGEENGIISIGETSGKAKNPKIVHEKLIVLDDESKLIFDVKLKDYCLFEYGRLSNKVGQGHSKTITVNGENIQINFNRLLFLQLKRKSNSKTYPRMYNMTNAVKKDFQVCLSTFNQVSKHAYISGTGSKIDYYKYSKMISDLDTLASTITTQNINMQEIIDNAVNDSDPLTF